MIAKRISRTLTALVLTGAMLLSPALAAGLRGNPVLTYALTGSSIALGVEGLEHGTNVYAAQITLDLGGEHPDAELTSQKDYVEVENRISVSGGQTKLTIYLDAQVPMNDGNQLELGFLNLDQTNLLPRQAHLVLLDAQLNRTEGMVSLRAPGSGGGGSSSGGNQPASYTANIKATQNGSVSVNPTRAAAGDRVTITTTPDKGYEVAAVNVSDQTGRSVSVSSAGENRFTFIQPKGAVTIQISFQKADAVVPPAGLPFVDVGEHDWFVQAASYVYEKGLMSGTSDTTFGPNITTTRGMIVTILHKMEGRPAASGVSFTDVPAEQYYANAVTWAAANGIVTGYGDGLFGPNDTITREQMAAILYKYAAYKGYDISKRAELSSFRDADTISSYAAESMSWANASGLINGMGDQMLEPRGSATRAQVAAILMQFCEQIAK